MQIDTSMPVMVTGATGYVAGRLVERLLEEGLTVHAAVRDPDNPDKLKYLNALAERTPARSVTSRPTCFGPVPTRTPWPAARWCSTPPRRSSPR